MDTARWVDRLMLPLLEGRRRECRLMVRKALANGHRADLLYHEVVWPAMERVEELYRDDRINTASQQMATRIGRTLVDQLQSHLEQRERIQRRILVISGEGESEELGAQMYGDLFEANGWDVLFIGGGVPNEDIVAMVGQFKPEIMLLFGAKPTDVPKTRKLIDSLRQTGVNPSMNVMVSGGVFNRATGLWQEVNADLFVETATEALETALSAKPRKAEVRLPGAPKKRRRRRRPPLLAGIETEEGLSLLLR